MSWPLSQDYNEAIQDPRTSFADAELKSGEAVTNALGIPMPRSGNFADVYEMRCPSGARWAVKCFTRQVYGLSERYSEIGKYLRLANLPFMVDFKYLEQGIRVRGSWYPVLKMQWVEGFVLNEFVRDNLDKKSILQALGQIWLRMAKRLRESYIAHCDLQHGNVLFVPGSSANSLAVKLIDYDGMCVPSLVGTKSGEVGHPAYQHSERLRTGAYDQEVDRFSLLSIAAALRCLAVGGRSLWERYDNGDNLLFRQSDFQAPAESPLFKELLTIGDAQAQTLVKELHRACQGPLDDVPLLTDLVSEEKPAGKTKTATPTIVKATAVQPAAASAEAGSAWAFEREGKAPSRRQRKGGVPRWVWGVAGGGTAAFVVLGGIFALAFQGETEKPKDKARIARKQPEKPPQRPVKSQEQTAPKEEQPEGDGQRKEGDVPPPPVVPDVPESNGVSDPPTANAKLEAVARELKVHNPGFEGTWAKAPGIEGDKIVSLVIQSDHVRDLTPLQDLPHLRQLTLNGTKVTDLTPLQGLPLSWLAISYSPVSDLSPLSGMKGLESLFVTAAPLIDLKPLEGLKLRELGLHATQVEDLSPLKGMPLKGLNIHRTRVKDLSPLKGMKLEGFCFYEQPVKDISVLKDMPLRDVGCPFQRERDEAVLRSIKTLKTINRKPAAQFWKEVDSTNTSGGSPTKGGQIPPKSPNVATEEKGFVPLFNGKDLTGWKTHPDDKPKWEVKDGILIGSGVGGHLFSERGDYENFHFRVEAMINDGGNSGQYFRTAFGPGFPKGYEAQINSTHADPIKTGSLYPAFSGKLTQEQRDKIIVRDMLVKPDEWFTQEVIARGNHIIIKVNDKTTVDFVDRNNTYTKGHFALQQHDLATVVKFRKIEVKELPAKAAESSPLRAQSDHPPEAKEVAAKAYEKACKDARAKLLKAFDTVLDQLAKRKGSIEARLKLIDTLKAEKTRFEYPGLIPWSAPMRPHVDQYLAELTVAQDKFRRAYNSLIDAQLRAKNESKVDDLRAELKKRIDVQVMAKWRYYLNGREVALHTLYSNGKIGNIYGKATWTYAKGVLTFRFPAPNGPGGAWIDTLNVSADGTTCAGTNNAPAGKGPKLTGVYVNDN